MRVVAVKVANDADQSRWLAIIEVYLENSIRYLARTLCARSTCEVDLMRALGQHPHIVGLLGYTNACYDGLSIVLEYCERGNLLSYLRKEVRLEVQSATAVSNRTTQLHNILAEGTSIHCNESADYIVFSSC